MTKLPFEVGVAHYDKPLPDVIHNIEELRDHDAFRFANRLHAWADIEDGRIVAAGQDGTGYIGSTTMRLGKRAMTFPAIPLPDMIVRTSAKSTLTMPGMVMMSEIPCTAWQSTSSA